MTKEQMQMLLDSQDKANEGLRQKLKENEETIKKLNSTIRFLEEELREYKYSVGGLQRDIKHKDQQIEKLKSIKLNDTFKRKTKVDDSEVARLRKQGFKQQEIAEILNIGIATVKRACKRLKAK